MGSYSSLSASTSRLPRSEIRRWPFAAGRARSARPSGARQPPTRTIPPDDVVDAGDRPPGFDARERRVPVAVLVRVPPEVAHPLRDVPRHVEDALRRRAVGERARRARGRRTRRSRRYRRNRGGSGPPRAVVRRGAGCRRRPRGRSAVRARAPRTPTPPPSGGARPPTRSTSRRPPSAPASRDSRGDRSADRPGRSPARRNVRRPRSARSPRRVTSVRSISNAASVTSCVCPSNRSSFFTSGSSQRAA